MVKIMMEVMMAMKRMSRMMMLLIVIKLGRMGGGMRGLPGAQHHMSSLKLSNTYVGTQNSKLIAKYDSLFG